MTTTIVDLMELVGAFGRYQILLLLFMWLNCVLIAAHTLSFIFNNISPPEICPNTSWNDTDWEAAARLTISNTSSKCDLLYAKRQVCSNWTFDDSIMSETIVTKYDLVCDREFLAPLSFTIYMIGFFVGSIIYGYTSDRFGRMKTLGSTGVHSFCASILSAFAPNIYVYLIARCILGVGTAGLCNVLYTIMAENTIPKHRGQALVVLNSGWSSALLFLTLISYLLRKSSYVGYALIVLNIVPIVSYFILHETPRWLLINKQYDRLKAVMRSIAGFNGRHISSNDEQLIDRIQIDDNEADEDASQTKVDFKSFFVNPAMRRVSLVVSFIFVTISLTYYGLSSGFQGLGGWNMFINMTISGLLELIGLIAMSPLLYRFNRISLLMIGYSLLSIFLILSAFFSSDAKFVFPMSINCLIARAVSAVYFGVSAVFAAEVYPTSHRNFGLGYCGAVTRVGAMVAPFVHFMQKLWPALPYLVYGAMNLVVVLSMISMPETRRHSPDTIADVQKMVRTTTLWSKCRRRKKNEDDIIEM